MKKKLIAVLLVCISIFNLVYLSACQNLEFDFTLKFIVDGELYATVKTLGNEVIKMPDDPEKEGYIFDGWYWDNGEWQRPFTVNSLLNEKLTSDMAVYAKWVDKSVNDDKDNPDDNDEKDDPNISDTDPDDKDDPSDADNTDNNNKPFVMGIYDAGTIFNPFFGDETSKEITDKTQVKLLMSDTEGQPYCGDDEPTVALNYSRVITLDGVDYANSVPSLGDRKPANISPEDYYTTYQFLIKNNMRFSDGEPLTINDVIFSLYTYLDPVYTGTSALSSTKIKGLMPYCTQEPYANKEYNEQLNKTVTSMAKHRLDILRYFYDSDDDIRALYRMSYDTLEDRIEIVRDVETVRYLFWDEIVGEYNNAVLELGGYIEQNKQGVYGLGFTEAWEVFLYNMGFINMTPKADGTIDIYKTAAEAKGHYDKNGKELKVGDKMIDYGDTWSWWHDKESLIKIVYNSYMGIVNDFGNYIASEDKGTKGDDGILSPTAGNGPKCDIITDDFGRAIGSSLKSSEADKNYWNLLWESQTLIHNLCDIVTNKNTANTAYEQFVAEEKSNWLNEYYFMVDFISGITVNKLHAGDEFVGFIGSTQLTEDMYVLQIVIDRVDPAAIWNFSFNVAPMHYYSNADNDINGVFTANDDYRSFNYPGCPGYDESKPVSVGRPFANIDYLNRVVKASNILSVPVGAGMYKVASKDTLDEKYAPELRPTYNEFYCDNTIYFIRNPYFYTTSGLGYGSNKEAISNGASITNCKIKYMQYNIISSTKAVNAIISGEIHAAYAIPNIERANLLGSQQNISFITMPKNGYGYIGINPKYVPDLEIRQAIMHAMDVNLSLAYLGDFGSRIYRPVSTVSWASPQNPLNPDDGIYVKFRQEPYYRYDQAGVTIDTLVQRAGYETKNGTQVGVRTLPDGTQHRLEYTFTVPGASDDHPAYIIMKNAAEILNEHGFKITVKIDADALNKIEQGRLEVWAGEQIGGIDPDIYSNYHKDAALSLKKWGYPQILNDPSGLYSQEKERIEKLSELIDEGRSSFDMAYRANVYYKAYDLIMDFAIELPVYQRTDLIMYNRDIIDIDTLAKNSTPYSGLFARLWEVSFKDNTPVDNNTVGDK
ncbi:MAG: InlB B-repeat-containing protein [Clostridiales bacterium]|nr:InlB B-repeat-containing protein [Clostridiales bacterium]